MDTVVIDGKVVTEGRGVSALDEDEILGCLHDRAPRLWLTAARS